MKKNKINPDIKELEKGVHKLYSTICEMPTELLSIPKGDYRQELGSALGVDETSIQNYSRPERNWPHDPAFYEALVPGINTAIVNYTRNLREHEQEVLTKKWSAIQKKYFELLDVHYKALQYLDEKREILSNMYLPEYMSRYYVTGFLRDEFSDFIEDMEDNSKKFFSLFQQQLLNYPGIDKNLLPMDEFHTVSEILNIFFNLNLHKIHFDIS